MQVPWNLLIWLCNWAVYPALLLGIKVLADLPSDGYSGEESSYNLDRTATQFRTNTKVREEVRQIVKSGRGLDALGSWFHERTDVTRNTIQMINIDTGSSRGQHLDTMVAGHPWGEFMMVVSPPSGDSRDAIIVSTVYERNFAESTSSAPTTDSTPKVNDGGEKRLLIPELVDVAFQLTNVDWLAKTVYFQFTPGYYFSRGVKRFLDWYLYDRYSDVYSGVERNGIVRQALCILPFNEDAQMYSSYPWVHSLGMAVNTTKRRRGDTHAEGGLQIHTTKTGPRNSNVDFVLKSAGQHAWLAPLPTQISRELNGFALHLPHTYFAERLIDAVTIQPFTDKTAEYWTLESPTAGTELSPATKQFEADVEQRKVELIKLLGALLRANNEMVLNFHHLSSQYWITEGRGVVHAASTMIGVILLVFALITAAYSEPFLDHLRRSTGERHRKDAELPSAVRENQPETEDDRRLKTADEDDQTLHLRAYGGRGVADALRSEAGLRSEDSELRSEIAPDPSSGQVQAWWRLNPLDRAWYKEPAWKGSETLGRVPFELRFAIRDPIEYGVQHERRLPQLWIGGSIMGGYVTSIVYCAGLAAVLHFTVAGLSPIVVCPTDPRSDIFRSVVQHIGLSVIAALGIFSVGFVGLFLFTRNVTAGPKSPMLSWLSWLDMVSRSCNLVITALLCTLYGLQPALGLLALFTVPVVAVLPAPLDWIACIVVISRYRFGVGMTMMKLGLLDELVRGCSPISSIFTTPLFAEVCDLTRAPTYSSLVLLVSVTFLRIVGRNLLLIARVLNPAIGAME